MGERTALDDVRDRIGILGIYKRRYDFNSNPAKFLCYYEFDDAYPHPLILARRLDAPSPTFWVGNGELRDFNPISLSDLTPKEKRNYDAYLSRHAQIQSSRNSNSDLRETILSAVEDSGNPFPHLEVKRGPHPSPEKRY